MRLEDEVVEYVRKWYLTIINDLCLPTEPSLNVMVKEFGFGKSGEFQGDRHTDPTTYLGIVDHGLLIGGTVGGKTTIRSIVIIYWTPLYKEADYVLTLATQLRHAWQFINRQPANNEDCERYAERFVLRFSEPDQGRYFGLVHKSEWDLAIAKKVAAKRKILLIAGFSISSIFALIGFGQFMSSYDGRPADANATRVIAGLLFIPLAVMLIVAFGKRGSRAARQAIPKAKIKAKSFKIEHKIHQEEKAAAYEEKIKTHPDNGKLGKWEVCGCVVTADSARAAIDRVSEAGLLIAAFSVPKYKGQNR